MDTTDAFARAHQAFVEALEKAADDPGVAERANQAFADSVELLREGWQAPAMVQAGQAFETYRGILRDGFQSDAAKASVDAAFTRYLDATREAWLATDVHSLDPARLGGIAESVRSIAWLAGVGREAGLDEGGSAATRPTTTGPDDPGQTRA